MMRRTLKWTVFVLGFSFLAVGCAASRPQIPMEQASSQPGGTVTRGGAAIKLLGTPVSLGQPLPSVKLVDAQTLKDADLSQEKGAVLFLSIVPSIDTKVCEEQTHYLGEEGERLPREIRRITISRDTPFAQKRFAAGGQADKPPVFVGLQRGGIRTGDRPAHGGIHASGPIGYPGG